MDSKFSVAVRTISGAQVLDQCGAVVIAGLRTRLVGVLCLHKDELLTSASCARDMRSVSFLGAVLLLRLVR